MKRSRAGLCAALAAGLSAGGLPAHGQELSLRWSPAWDLPASVHTLVSAHATVTRFEDRSLPTAPSGHAAAVGWRLARLVLLDVPIDYGTVIFAHEVAGHGARYRELDVKDVNYGLDWPPPYGDGGGQASVNLAPGETNRYETLAIWEGGIEAHTRMLRELRMQWLVEGRVPTRQSFLYFWAFQVAHVYVLDTQGDIGDDGDENDPQAYVRLLNAGVGAVNPDEWIWHVDDLQDAVGWNVADPFLIAGALYGIGRYLWTGAHDVSLPMVRTGGAQWLPLAHAALTPFGIAWHGELYVRSERGVAWLDLYRGDETFHGNWGGGRIELRSSDEDALLRALSLDIWRQPPFEDPVSQGNGELGGAVSVTLARPFGSDAAGWTGVVELGAKRRGYAEGWPLAGGPRVALGLGRRW